MTKHCAVRAFSTAFAVLVCAACAAWADEPKPFQGEKDLWNGFDRYTFEVEGRTCYVAAPKKSAEGRPWVWRARFWGHRPEVDCALLEKGFHVAHIDVAGLYGSPAAVELWDLFYWHMTKEHGLARKLVLEGMSHGGLIVYNWAVENPRKVACIYADAPVLDFKSWPGGKGAGTGSPKDWEMLLKVYEFEDEAAAIAYEKNPVDRTETLSIMNIPMLHVCGADDEVVPYAENAGLFKKHYEEHKGTLLEEIIKPGVGHEHGLDDPAPIIGFILRNTIDKPVPTAAQLGDFSVWETAQYYGRADVRVEDGVAIVEMGHDMTGIRWPGPLRRMDYEIELEAKRVEGEDFFCGLTFPVGEAPCSFICGGWGGTVVGLSNIDFNDAYNNETCRFKEFENGRWYRIRVRVTQGRIEAWIDDDQFVNIDVSNRNVDIRWEMEPCVPLGIATWRTTGALRNFRMYPVAGPASKLPEDDF